MTAPNPQVPDPNDVTEYNPQQVPAPPRVEYVPMGAMQLDMQRSWGQTPVGTEVQAGFPQLGPGVYGPTVPTRRRTSYKLTVILLAVGLLLAVSPFLAEGLIGLVLGNHGDDGDGLPWLAITMSFYLTSLDIILILVSGIVAITVALTNSSSKN